MAAVGFEPTTPERLVPKTSALDHSATLPDMKRQTLFSNQLYFFNKNSWLLFISDKDTICHKTLKDDSYRYRNLHIVTTWNSGPAEVEYTALWRYVSCGH